MLNVLKSKIIMGFAVFGALFSLILAMFAGVSLFWLIIRIFAGAILMGGLGFGLDLFLRQSLSAEDYKALFEKTAADYDPLGTMKKFDVTDDAGLSPEEEYKSMYQNETPDMNTGSVGTPVSNSGDHASQPSSNNKSHTPTPSPEYPDSYNLPPESAQNTGQTTGKTKSFQEDDLDSVPRVSTIGGTGNPENDLKSVESLGREIKVKQAFAANPNIDGSVKFNIGNKKITADPKVIAKAIRTVLNRDK